MNYIHNIEELVPLLNNTKKCKLVGNLTKNYIENIHYIIEKTNISSVKGGRPKTNYMLTKKTYELLKNSYNFRNRYIVNASDNINVVNNFAMCIENQTIGFIENSFNDVIKVIRQFKIGIYKVDLYFPEYKLVVECDENNHVDRNIDDEKIRQEFILSQGKILLRYNPNKDKFDLSLVFREINKVLLLKNDKNRLILL
jgi:hypothetical protein